ncbi:FG-GAP-like repeat-containing protein, partial [Microbulbifer rhizosphaerae]
DFRVNESGAATYSIPLSLPAGTAGVAPELSLNYSSQGGNGLVGHGWALGGLSAISRCRQTLGQDKQAKAITWSGEDRFCLDGQRLLAVEEGTYGKPGSLYRTEIDSFALIKAHGGTDGHPDYFTVERKDGSISYYGDGNRSRQRVMVGDKTRTLTWGISRFEDSALNPIEFVYAADVDRDEPNHDISHRISEIRYAYTSGGSAGAKMVFDYKGRQDPISGYLAGELLQTKKRLSGIRVQNDSGNGLQEVRRYTLEYLSDPRDNLSRLERIRQCAGPNGTLCQPDTVFDWRLPLPGSFAGGVRDSVILSTQRDRAAVGARPADINGDGRMDLIWLEADWDDDGEVHDQYFRYVLADESGFGLERLAYRDSANVGKTPYRWEMMDYNGDGRADVAFYAKKAEEWRILLSLPRGNGNWQLSSNYLAAEGLKDKDVRFIDINGDGLVDAVSSDGYWLMEIDPNEPISSHHYYRFAAKEPLTVQGLESWTLEDPDNQSREHYLSPGAAGDFNGDGRVNLILFDTKKTRVGTGRRPGWLQEQHTRAYRVSIEGDAQGGYQLVNRGKLLDFGQSGEDFESKNRDSSVDALERHGDLKQKVHVADINGDGLADLILQDDTYDDDSLVEKARYHYRLSTGQSFKDAVSLGVMPEEAQLQWFDYDNDGDQDLVWHDAGRRRLRVRRWNELQQQFSGSDDFRITSGNEQALHLFTDMDGDGVTDYVRVESDIAVLHPATGFLGPVNVIEKITNGLGAETDIAYGSLANSGHYTHLVLDTTTESHDEPEVNLQCGGEYRVASTGSFYSALNDSWEGQDRLGKLSPTLELIGPMYVATRVDSSAPTAGDASDDDISSISYHYAQAKLQAGGRGLLGFEKLCTVDEQTGVVTTTTYRQDFPFRGYPLSTEVKTAAGKLLSRSTNTWKLKKANGAAWQSGWRATALADGSAELGSLQPWLAESIEETYDLNGNTDGDPLKTVTTVNEYDNHGNPLRITVTTLAANGDTFITDTENDYGEGRSLTLANTDHMLSGYPELGRLVETIVIHTRTENGATDSVKRISRFDYHPDGPEAGLLWWEKVEPDDDTLRLTSTYTYDDFGNKETATQATAGEEPRSSRWTYQGGQGRYLETEENAYRQVTSRVLARDELGQPTLVEDIAGVQTLFDYDAFGRKVLEYNQTGAHSITLLSAPGDHCPAGSAYQQTAKDAGGAESLACFDVVGRKTRSATRGFDGAWVYADTEYDNLGRVSRKSEPYSGSAQYWTAMDYDILGRVVGTDLPGTLNNNGITGTDGLPHDVHVDYQGYKTVTTNPEGHTKTETKNAQGELVFVKDNLGGKLEYRYDAQGNLRFATRTGDKGGLSTVTEMRYDKLGRKEYMSDLDKGEWHYGYNGFGELEWQIDAKRQMVVNEYDRLGRLERRTDYRNGDIEDPEELNTDGNIESETLWSYNNNRNKGDGSPHWEEDVPPGALAGVIGVESDYAEVPSYDRFGRLDSQLTSLAEGDDHWTRTTYDQYGRVFQQFDAGGDGTWRSSATENVYNQYGYLEAVVDAENINQASGENFYTVLAMDERGNVTRFRQGNGVVTDRTYDPATGRLEHQTASVLGITQVQDLTYQWSNLGNLENRRDRSGGKNLFEEFQYDGLNRLKRAQVSAEGMQREAQIVEYDGLGNIEYKSDVGDYYYAGDSESDEQCDQKAGPHAVCATSDGVTYSYDANGNMTSDSSGRTLVYTTFDKPETITKGGHTTEFRYGPDRSRYLRIDTDSSNNTTETRYIGNVEKITKSDGSREIKRYLPGGAIVTLSTESDGSTSRTSRYLHKDHLGSVDVITDKSGTVIQELSFDPWGQRRNAQDWTVLIAADLTGFDTSLTTRGYTGHEMLDQVGLIHMNGRIYDARLGRFLQADPFIQAASDTQMYNRYSYVRNNPLVYTDSSGYKIDFWSAVKIVIAVVLTVACEGACGPEVWAWAMGTTSAAQAITQGGDFEQIATAAFTGAVMGYFGASLGAGGWTGTEAFYFGVVGGITSVLQGGKFGHGFVSAYVGAAVNASGVLQGQSGPVQFLGSVVVGGTVSEATGGKFANGAVYAAFAFAVGRITYKDWDWRKNTPDLSECGGAVSCGATVEEWDPDGESRQGFYDATEKAKSNRAKSADVPYDNDPALESVDESVMSIKEVEKRNVKAANKIKNKFISKIAPKPLQKSTEAGLNKITNDYIIDPMYTPEGQEILNELYDRPEVEE